MKYVRIGRIVNTHALKGEVRIISNFEYKNKVFNNGFVFYIGDIKEKLIIDSYRVHKQFDMVKFLGIDDINDALKYKGKNVYVNYDDLKLKSDELIESDIINSKLFCNNELIGIISEYRVDNGNKMIRVNNKLIPFNKDFIDKTDKDKKEIYMHDIEVFI